MSEVKRLHQFIESLGREIAGARAESDQGQFPILDLLGNMRDEAAQVPETRDLHACCAQAWERVVTTIESGRVFSAADVQWLHELLQQIQALSQSPTPTLAPEPAPEPAATGSDSQLSTPNSQLSEDLPLALNLQSDEELLREFIHESREHLDNIEQGVLVLEHRPEDAETLNTVFRAFHTFKGSAGFLNLLPINRLAHVLESLLDLARQGQLTIDGPMIDLILQGRDVLKQFVEEIEGQISGTRPVAPIQIPTTALKAEVQAMLDAVAAGEPGVATPHSPATPAGALPGTPAPAPAPVARVSAEEAPVAQRAEQRSMVKVDTGKLDSLLDLVGEMVIAQSLVAQDLNRLTGLSPQFTRNMAQLSRITKELQRVSMAMRMLPIRGLFQKMARVVRDLGAKQQKSVQLLTSGEDTELDRGVVEELNDPLLHMIRNAIDHGVESPEVRQAQGKPALASIHLRAYHQGGNIVLEIADDGAGLNQERILAKAIERGLTTAAAQHTPEEIFNFIFAPGFSTAQTITDISGRGVGLDVVRRNIERLRGCVDIVSIPGQGTTFKITLPLTLAIIDGLIVKVGEERYILPTLSVRESFRPRAEMLTRVQGVGEVVNVRGRLIPLLRLYQAFGLTPVSTDPTQSLVVVVQSGGTYRCLLVDGLLHKQEVVIKNLNELMVHKNRALAGATILGDGRVGLILDVNSLVHQENQTFSKAA